MDYLPKPLPVMKLEQAMQYAWISSNPYTVCETMVQTAAFFFPEQCLQERMN